MACLVCCFLFLTDRRLSRVMRSTCLVLCFALITYANPVVNKLPSLFDRKRTVLDCASNFTVCGPPAYHRPSMPHLVDLPNRRCRTCSLFFSKCLCTLHVHVCGACVAKALYAHYTQSTATRIFHHPHFAMFGGTCFSHDVAHEYTRSLHRVKIRYELMMIS